MDYLTSKSWTFTYIYTHNFVDFKALTDPVSRYISFYTLEYSGDLTFGSSSLILSVPLVLHEVEFKDGLYNPIVTKGSNHDFISADSQSTF